VELIVLNLGLDAKVIDVEQFTIFVLMALITTFATSPGTAAYSLFANLLPFCIP
jgi:hypothetical protein